MKTARLDQMVRGWFVGDFDPVAHRTPHAEAGVKHYRAGDHEPTHYHKIATEITLIVQGEVKMFGRTFREGDIIVVEPGDATDFTALSDAITAVIKVPGVTGDKYPGEPGC
jgi:quercetin dioxygenase-like cupin family protein